MSFTQCRSAVIVSSENVETPVPNVGLYMQNISEDPLPSTFNGGGLLCKNGELYFSNSEKVTNITAELEKYSSIALEQSGSGAAESVVLGNSLGNFSYSVVAGHEAGKNATVEDSVLVGYQAGSQMNTGGAHVIIGKDCAKDMLSGEGNTLVGYRTFHRLTTGSNNVGIGEVGQNVLESYNNVAIGENALNSAGAIGENIAIGTSAMGMCKEVNNNIAIGHSCLETTEDGYNIAVGIESCATLRGQNANHNIALGHQCMNNVQQNSTYNIAMGYRTMASPACFTFNNVLIGNMVAETITTDLDFSYNVLIGEKTATENQGLADTIAIGRNVCSGAAGSNIIAMGTNAATNISGKLGGEIIFGNGAGSFRSYSDITNKESRGVLVGWLAGSGKPDAIAGGDNAVVIGNCAGMHSGHADTVVMIGYQAGKGASKTQNLVGIGNNSGYNSSGKNNVFIGTNSGAHLSGDNNIVIGNSPLIASSSGAYLTNNSILIGRESLYGTNNIIISTGGMFSTTEEHENTFLIGSSTPFLYGDLTTGALALGQNLFEDDLWGGNTNCLYLEESGADKLPPNGLGGIIYTRGDELRHWASGNKYSSLVHSGHKENKLITIEKISEEDNVSLLRLGVTGSGWINITFKIMGDTTVSNGMTHIGVSEGQLTEMEGEISDGIFEAVVSNTEFSINSTSFVPPGRNEYLCCFEIQKSKNVGYAVL